MPTVDLARLARTAVTNATREYPYALITVVDSADDLRLPREQHPAFFGCYDWHSAVHTHWLLVRLLRDHADAIDAGAGPRRPRRAPHGGRTWRARRPT